MCSLKVLRYHVQDRNCTMRLPQGKLRSQVPLSVLPTDSCVGLAYRIGTISIISKPSRNICERTCNSRSPPEPKEPSPPTLLRLLISVTTICPFAVNRARIHFIAKKWLWKLTRSSWISLFLDAFFIGKPTEMMKEVCDVVRFRSFA